VRVSVRAARDDDDLDGLNETNPIWLGAHTILEGFAAAPPGIPKAILVAELDGRPVGYAHGVALGISDGHRGMASLYVPPEHRGQGVGGALWAAVLDLCPVERVPGVKLATSHDDETSQAIALAHGLRLGGLHLESVLDLTRRDLPVVPAPGLELRPVADDEAGWRAAYALYVRLSADTPDAANGSEDMPYEVFRAFHPEPLHLLLAHDGDVIVGLTAVMVVRPDERGLNTSLTAVDPAYRGRGLATALKTTHARLLAAAGWRSIRTQNMDGNEPILAANRRLGFVPAGGAVDLLYDYPTRR
jgi:GNAT superfamily N-acetyltransferase